MNDGVYNQDFLNTQPAVHETKYLRHVHFEHPIVAKMDGKRNKEWYCCPIPNVLLQKISKKSNDRLFFLLEMEQ